MIEVKLPSLGVAILDAKIINWLKEEGENVKKDEPIAEVETDKVTFEVVSPVDGFLIKKLYNVGDLVKVNEPLAFVDVKNDELIITNTTKEEKEKNVQQKRYRVDISNNKDLGVLNRKKIANSTPAAKNIAKKNNVNLEKITGSGPNNLITKEDVLKYLKQVDFDKEGSLGKEEEIIPFEGIRKQIAERLSASKNSKVQVTTTVEVDVTNTETIRDLIKKELNEKYDIHISILSFVIKAAIEAIKIFPILNSTLEKDKIIMKRYINFGIAIESSKGLIVPVIRHSERLSFWQLMKEIDTLIQKARKGTLTPEYIGDGTITISNAGSFGSILSTPVILGNQSALLWLGKINKRPVVDENDQIKIRKIMNLCISYDHRVVDGAQVAKFLNEISVWLENPVKLLMNEIIK